MLKLHLTKYIKNKYFDKWEKGEELTLEFTSTTEMYTYIKTAIQGIPYDMYNPATKQHSIEIYAPNEGDVEVKYIGIRKVVRDSSNSSQNSFFKELKKTKKKFNEGEIV